MQKKENVDFSFIEPKHKLSDLIVSQETLELFTDIISMPQNMHKVFNEWGMQNVISQKPNITVNLYGESGTGKTMAAHAIAHAMSKRIVCVDYAEIESKYVGET